MICVRKPDEKNILIKWDEKKMQADEPILRMLMLLMNANVVRNSKDKTGICTKTTEKGLQQEFTNSFGGVFSKQSL